MVLSIFLFPGSYFAPDAYAAEEAEFDPNFLQHAPGKTVIDIQRFTHGNPVPAGQYYADVYLNGELKGRTNLRFSDISDSSLNSSLCTTPDLLSLLDLKPEALSGDRPSLSDESQAKYCVSMASYVPSSVTRFELSTLRLDVTVPQALVTQRPRGYIDPIQWQQGVPAAFVRYDASNYQYHTSGKNNSSTYIGFRAGLNVDGWAVRHRGAVIWTNGDSGGYRSTENNIQHDIAVLRGQLILGDFTTGGELMDSVSLRGIKLNSDDRMLPGSLRGYAPVVRGIASSNAQVTIRQNGNTIYETTVPAGPFTISDLYPSGYGGDLRVTVTESDGQTRTFTVPFASVARLVRPGYMRYQVSAGHYRYANKTLKDTVFQGTLQYGLTNDVTVNSGFTTAPHYAAGLAGVAFNTPLGAVASDVTISRATCNRTDTPRKGYSLHASYSVILPSTSTGVTLAAYRYSSKDFYNLQDAIRANHYDYIDDVTIKGADFYRPRNQLQLSVNQSLKTGWGNIYLTGSTYNYWGHQGSCNEYQAGYNNFYRRLNYQIGYSRALDNNTYRRDERIFVNLSFPLGAETHGAQLSTTLSYNKGERNSTQTAVSGVTGHDNQFSYGLSANTLENGPSGYTLNAGYRAPYALMTTTAGKDSHHNRQVSFGVSGAVVAHPYGVTLSNDLSDTFTIIHAEGAGGAVVNSAPGNRLDFWGNGIVPYVTPYEKNAVSIDPDGLPMNVELSATVQEIVPKANSATLVNFTTQTGPAMLFDIRLPDGDIPPMASEAINEKGNSVGWVAQGGRLFARGLAEQGIVKVIWGADSARQCTFPYRVKPEQNPGAVPSAQAVQCTGGQ
ncbi:fimbrial biogenesis outer membrane usher protein [Salmonella enterica]